MYILLVNDDGIYSPGLRALYFALKKAGHEVVAVAPMRQQSGVGHSLTVFEPLKIEKIKDEGFSGYGVYGTPTDCVKLALAEIVGKKPDLVMAGINLGQNSGPDINYSGTVGAAAEAAHASLPSMAISHGEHEPGDSLPDVATHVVALAEKIDFGKIAAQRVINVNYPPGPASNWRGVRVCHQSPAVWGNAYKRELTADGNEHWWLMGEIDPETVGADSDRGLLQQGFITVTPLKFEFTDYPGLEALRELEKQDLGHLRNNK